MEKKTIYEFLPDKNAFRDNLREKGLTQAQINSKTAEIIIDTIAENSGLFISELKTQVDDLKEETFRINERLYQIYGRNEDVVNRTNDLIKAIEDSKDVAGNINNEQLRDLLIAFNGMLHICTLYQNIDMTEALNSIGYVLYAFYGGQAKRLYGEVFDGGGPK